MRLHYRAGDRTTALRQYERCAAVMAKHFGVPPSQETAALYGQIRADRLDDNGLQEVPAARRAGEPGGSLLLGLHARLDQFQAELAASQRQVQRELTSIRRVLGQGRQTQ
jgi:hypothetical protein